jgi:flagellar motor switch protein FliM
MSINRVLTQGEIDDAFRKIRDRARSEEQPAVQGYDFRRSERIPKDQLHSIRLLHENFARRLAASLSAYLRAYVVVNVVSMEQISFTEFTEVLPSPTILVSLGIKPYDGFVLLEINPSLVFPILEMLLGGTGKVATKVDRAITEIEQNILDGLLGIVLNELRGSWLAVTAMEFSIESHETEPQLSQIGAPSEPVVAIGIEVNVGETTAGMMNIAIPSVILKMLRQKFDHHGSARRAQATDEDQMRMLRLIQQAAVLADARLQGPTLGVDALLELKEDDILVLDYPIDRPLDLMVNGRLKYRGEVVTLGRKRAFRVEQACPSPVLPATPTGEV